MGKRKILFVINQMFKGGAETALISLFNVLDPQKYEIDLLVYDQIDLNDTISLVPRVPAWINVSNTAQNEAAMAYVKKAVFKLYRNVTGRQLFRIGALEYLKDRCYDTAISYGEWFSCRLVAEKVCARRKYVWIHADMDKASFLQPDIIRYQNRFDGFIFASYLSMRGAQEKYPFLNGRSYVVHNQTDRSLVCSLAEEPLQIEMPKDDLPVLVTVANLREEKNHIRQVEAMRLLFERGIQFHWINVGSLNYLPVVEPVQQAVDEAGLNDYFWLCGAQNNPYPFIKAADAVCVLSDHESWSMVITEAKCLGVPVIATRTSGALEQLRDGETGVLCNFSAEDIADKIEGFLCDPVLQVCMRENLGQHNLQDSSLHVLNDLLTEEKQKILYVFDDVNYVSGARNAAIEQMKVLSEAATVNLFSITECKDEGLREQFKCFDIADDVAMNSLLRPFMSVIRSKEYSIRQKLMRAAYAVLARFGFEAVVPNLLLGRAAAQVFEDHDAVCVVSEGSKLREFVSECKHPRKIQWIHTDYAAWRERSDWTRAITKNDERLYEKFDTIVCLNETLRRHFAEVYPRLEAKTVAIPNLIPYEAILCKAEEPSEFVVEKSLYNLITVGRMDAEKRYDRLLSIAKELKKQDFAFHWYFVGDGPLREEIERLCDELNLRDVVTVCGAIENPYPLMKQCDLFVLLSQYEGTPVTIDEAKVIGLPVLANDVGGVREQLGECGTVINTDDQVEIVNLIVQKKNDISFWTEERIYQYNQRIEKQLNCVLV